MKPSQSPISTANIGRALTFHGNESCSQIHSFPLFTGERASRDAPIPPFRRRRSTSLSPFSETSPPPRYTRFHHLQKIEFRRDAPIPPFRRRRLPSLSPFSETSPAPRYTRFHHLQKNRVSRDAPIPPFRHRESTSPSPFTETSPHSQIHSFPPFATNRASRDAPIPPFRHRRLPSLSPFSETSPAPRYTRFPPFAKNRASPKRPNPGFPPSGIGGHAEASPSGAAMMQHMAANVALTRTRLRTAAGSVQYGHTQDLEEDLWLLFLRNSQSPLRTAP